MKMEKFFSLSLALVMALTLTTPSFADDEELPVSAPEEIEEVQDPVEEEAQDPVEEEAQDPVEDGVQDPVEDEVQDPVEDEVQDPVEDEVQDPVEDEVQDPAEDEIQDPLEDIEDIIDVTVPAIGEVVLNPYGLSVETETGETWDQVVHQPQGIMNYSDFPVSVNAAVTGSLESDAWLVTAPPDPDGLDKELFLYVEFGNDAETWNGSYTGAPNQLLVTEDGSAGDGVLVLDGGSEGYFRLFGAMTPYPDVMWGEENALTVTIAYTFSRAVAEDVEPDENDPDSPLPEQPDDPTVSEPSEQPDDPAVSEPLPEPDAPAESDPLPEPDVPAGSDPLPEPDDSTGPEQSAGPDDSVPPPGTPAQLDYGDVLPEGTGDPADF